MKLSFSLLMFIVLLGGRSFCVDRTAFTFTRYDLEVRVDPDGHAISARGKITLRNDSRTAQPTAPLQISSSLTWQLIRIGGEDAQYLSEAYTSDVDHTGVLTEAVVTLPKSVQPHESVQLEVGYSGTIEANATRLTRIGTPEQIALRSDWDQISPAFTAVRGVGNVVWYPISMPAVNLSESDITAEVGGWQAREAEAQMRTRICWITDSEQRPSVVASGSFEGVSSVPDTPNAGCSDFRFASLGTSVPSFAIGNFKQLKRGPVSIYHVAGHESGATALADASDKVLPLVQEWFGAPRQPAQIVEIDSDGAVPFESGTLLFTPVQDVNPKFTQLTMVHQLTHAAFPSSRLWIYEGLAHFAMVLEREQQDGRASAISFMQGRLPALLDTEKQVAAAGGSSAIDDSLLATENATLYRTKAMFVWWMLRDMIGNSVLQAVLKDYRTDRDTRPDYVQQLVQAKLPKHDLEWFFDGWVYRDHGLPDFQMVSAYPRETLNGNYIVTVTIENTGKVGAEVPVMVRNDVGAEQSVRVLVAAKQSAITRVSVPWRPIEARSNDGSVPEADVSNNSLKIAAPPSSQPPANAPQ